MNFGFHPLIKSWFSNRFSEPTEPQRRGWPEIARGIHTLIAAPTGSGKTLTAFLCAIDELLKKQLDGTLEDTVYVLYVSPLRALSNDIERNLREPLAEIGQRFTESGNGTLGIRVAVRTGDTTASQRAAMIRKPPHILVTTPESLYILLTSVRGKEILDRVQTVIVDEIHALARDKRGSHLALSLERLVANTQRPPQRIGLSATQRPLDQIGEFLSGGELDREDRWQVRPHIIVDGGHVRDLKLEIEVPPSELSAVCGMEQWEEIYTRLTECIDAHRSTLVFVNTRRLAERITLHLSERLGEDAVASHHGSLSKELRLTAEQRLKAGTLRAIVATASLEMGIDIGYIDLVCQIGSPRGISTLLQRVGRSGHTLGTTPSGRLFPLTRDELMECMALVKAVRRGELDAIEIPQKPLDILAQQLIATVSAGPYSEAELLKLVRRAWPYRNLEQAEFDKTVEVTSHGVVARDGRGAHLHRDRLKMELRPRRSARIAAITNGGAIPETAEFRVVLEEDETFVGSLDEDFAIESQAGDIFVLGNTSWRVSYVRNGKVVVQDAQGAPPTIPFWFGESPGRTPELSEELSRLRSELADRLKTESESDVDRWLKDSAGVNDFGAAQARQYVAAQVEATGFVPTHKQVFFERFFDESGGMQLVVHSPYGARVNRAWGWTLRKRFCRSFDFELQAAADDNGILLSLSPQHSFPIPALFKMLGPHNARELLEQALLAVPLFLTRWRWNVTRALAVARRINGKKVPPHLQRFRSDDLLAVVFPQTVGCLENHSGDIKVPDHPLVQQTMIDCLTEALDVHRFVGMLAKYHDGQIEFVPMDTREPSPFCHGLLNANPYAFLDDAPLEERRTRAVYTRRSLAPGSFDKLAQLDIDAVRQVIQDAQPQVRSEDELYDVLRDRVAIGGDDQEPWRPFFLELVKQGRATRAEISSEPDRTDGTAAELWVSIEQIPTIDAVYGQRVVYAPAIEVPEALRCDVEPVVGRVELVRGQFPCRGPTSARLLATELGLPMPDVAAALEAIEGEGVVLRGDFVPGLSPDELGNEELQWCDRRLLARIHRLTLDGLRRQIQPVSPDVYLRFLFHRHRLTGESKWRGAEGVKETVHLLEGWEAPAGLWENELLARRTEDYDTKWLDEGFLEGKLMWGRLRSATSATSAKGGGSWSRQFLVSMMQRDDLAWLLPNSREAVMPEQLDAAAVDTLTALNAHGALFSGQVESATGLLPAQVEDALKQLAARGAVTSDAFSAIRKLVKPGIRKRQLRMKAQSGVGRWSLFPGLCAPVEEDVRLVRWCYLLLRRYGVIFRDVVARESAAPPWYRLLSCLRKMELRGELRGGRFIRGVSGEQFADEQCVRKLRETRDQVPSDEWIIVSAADPMNLSGIIDDGPKVSVRSRNRVLFYHGRCLAYKDGAIIEIVDEVDCETAADLRRSLTTGTIRKSRPFVKHESVVESR